MSPYDTAASAGTRFMVELIAWTAGPFAAAELLGSRWWSVPTFMVLTMIPGVCNTPGDKNIGGIPTPGPIRIAIEMLLLVVAVLGAWIVWPGWAALPILVLGLVMLATGLARYRWLAQGAPPVDQR